MARKTSMYDNSKMLKVLPGFHYRPLEDSIKNACGRYLSVAQT
jgi:hypothetical protein